MRTYIFRIELEEEEDGRWSVWVPALPGCASWGNTKDEALENIQDAIKACLEVLLEEGRPIPCEPEEVQVIEAPAVSVTL